MSSVSYPISCSNSSSMMSDTTSVSSRSSRGSPSFPVTEPCIEPTLTCLHQTSPNNSPCSLGFLYDQQICTNNDNTNLYYNNIFDTTGLSIEHLDTDLAKSLIINDRDNFSTNLSETDVSKFVESKNTNYWNLEDCRINDIFSHTLPVYSQDELLKYQMAQLNALSSISHNNNNNNNSNYINKSHITQLTGMSRYWVDSNGHRIATTLQGAVYSAIDLLTGRRVIIKRSKKCLVEKHCTRDGVIIAEDIRQEANLLSNVSKDESSDAGISKFVEFFHDKDYYYLVTEHGGLEFFTYVTTLHEIIEKNANSRDWDKLVSEWKTHVRYHFRIIVRAIYYLHCLGIAHRDLSLENTVINTIGDNKKNGNSICRIIDFGLSLQHNKKEKLNINDEWKHNQCCGKTLYQSPEIVKLNILNKNNYKITNNDLYDPRSADIWSLGVMLFIMLVGSPPFHIAHNSQPSYEFIMAGKMKQVLIEWKSENLVEPLAFDLMEKIFKLESNRINIEDMLNHPYVKDAPRYLRPNEFNTN